MREECRERGNGDVQNDAGEPSLLIGIQVVGVARVDEVGTYARFVVSRGLVKNVKKKLQIPPWDKNGKRQPTHHLLAHITQKGLEHLRVLLESLLALALPLGDGVGEVQHPWHDLDEERTWGRRFDDALHQVIDRPDRGMVGGLERLAGVDNAEQGRGDRSN